VVGAEAGRVVLTCSHKAVVGRSTNGQRRDDEGDRFVREQREENRVG